MSESGDDHINSLVASFALLAENGVAAGLTFIVLLPIIFSSTVHRSAVSANLYVSLILFCLSYCILPIIGQWNIAKPTFGPCIISAMALYASFPLCAGTISALSLSLWLGVFQKYSSSNRRLIDTFLIVVPYVVWIGMMTLVFVYGNNHKNEVVRNGYPHCFITGSIIKDISRGLMMVFFVPCFVLQGFTIRRLFSVSSPFHNNPELRNTMRSPIIRMSILCISSAAIVGISLSLGRNWGKATQLVFLGSFPLVVIIIFGTQKEVMKSWARWLTPASCVHRRKDEPYTSSLPIYFRSKQEA